MKTASATLGHSLRWIKRDPTLLLPVLLAEALKVVLSYAAERWRASLLAHPYFFGGGHSVLAGNQQTLLDSGDLMRLLALVKTIEGVIGTVLYVAAFYLTLRILRRRLGAPSATPPYVELLWLSLWAFGLEFVWAVITYLLAVWQLDRVSGTLPIWESALFVLIGSVLVPALVAPQAVRVSAAVMDGNAPPETIALGRRLAIAGVVAATAVAYATEPLVAALVSHRATGEKRPVIAERALNAGRSAIGALPFGFIFVAFGLAVRPEAVPGEETQENPAEIAAS